MPLPDRSKMPDAGNETINEEGEMKFQPRTEEEIQMEGLLEPGEYDFEVSSAKDETSKAGNQMIHLTLKAYEATGGRSVLVDDYLLPDGGFAFKLRHLCASLGLMEQYEAGELEAWHLQGKAGRVKLKIEQNKSGQYPPRNTVADYVVGGMARGVVTAREAAIVGVDLRDDDIPF